MIRLLLLGLALLSGPARVHAEPPSAPDAAATAGQASPPPCPTLQRTGPLKLVDLNRADEQTLLALPGIGPARARAIIAYRAQHGRFRNVSQLLHIRGIGRSLLRQLRPLVTLSDPTR